MFFLIQTKNITTAASDSSAWQLTVTNQGSTGGYIVNKSIRAAKTLIG